MSWLFFCYLNTAAHRDYFSACSNRFTQCHKSLYHNSSLLTSKKMSDTLSVTIIFYGWKCTEIKVFWFFLGLLYTFRQVCDRGGFATCLNVKSQGCQEEKRKLLNVTFPALLMTKAEADILLKENVLVTLYAATVPSGFPCKWVKSLRDTFLVTRINR